MEIRDRIAQEFDKRKEGLLIFAVLLGFGFVVNIGTEIKGLYMDDLYLWSCYGEQSFGEFVFPVGSTRFRFIFYLAAWLELLLLGNHISLIVPFNIFVNALIAFSVYRIAVNLSGKRKFISLSLAFAYLISRLAYYQIGQMYGLMESLGLWAAIGILWFLYRYVNGRDTASYFLACLLYFAASFIHERYMVLGPVLLLALIMGSVEKRPRRKPAVQGEPRAESDPSAGTRTDQGRSRSRTNRPAMRTADAVSAQSVERSAVRAAAQEKKLPKWILFLVSIGVFLLIQGIRLVTIGTLSPAGTGGTDVADTFLMEDAIAHAWEQVAFVFGRNSGPDYLCVLPFADSPENIQNLILASNVVLGVSVLCFIVCVLIFDRSRFFTHLKNSLLFLAFIALCIGSSSVTIRVEMRWVYVVYAVALLFLAYMSQVMGYGGVLVFAYVALMFQTETYYRSHWDNLYFWPNQLRYNSLAEQTVGKYGDDIFDKQVYIIGNTYGLDEFTADTFLHVYDSEGRADDARLLFIDSDFDFKEIGDGILILAEDPEHNAYLDVTDFVKKQRFNLAYGSYEDGWIDENAKIVFLNEETDRVVLSCYYPGAITGNEICRIRVNGKTMPDLVFTDNLMYYEIPAAPYQMISVEFSCNFHVRNAKETRGEENLAMIVKIVSDD